MNEITPYHAKYYAYELSIQHSTNSVDRISQSLFDASVDLNPHQIEASLFALNNPLSKGVILADEVGLGKTIEAGLVLCQHWAERKRKLIIICPASLRRQWAQELTDKFNLPSIILDARTWSKLQASGVYNPLELNKVIIVSYHYATRIEEKLITIPWSLVVIDEAHKLRNAHRESNKIGQSIRRAFYANKKLLLTATPLQNSLIELFGLSTLIDEHIFGDDKSFRKQYMSVNGDLAELKDRLGMFVKRTLRKQVLEYVSYTERKTITTPFYPSEPEQVLYDSVSAFLEREESYALPKKHRHLTGLILRKLLASSSHAVLNTLETIKRRLEKLRDYNIDEDFIPALIEDDDIETDYLDELPDEEEEKPEEKNTHINVEQLELEIQEFDRFIQQAKSIKSDSKLNALRQALKTGFSQLDSMGANDKAIIFTESKRTQEYVLNYLEANGFSGKVVSFSGTNNSPEATKIYKQWLEEYKDSDQITGSPQIDRRTALIDYFKNHAQIMIATEAAAEGVNLQFCSLLINYDLPWNPQRVEQRIGRCHRYGQKFDVVVINFLNQRNYADQRVLELLTQKFKLFDGVFGASDEVLGSIESGVDFEKRIQSIYETCRTPEAIAIAFDELQKQLEEDINSRIRDTQQLLIENFDEDIHDLLKLKLDQAEQRLDKVSRWFWALTKYQLKNKASFNNENYSFRLIKAITDNIPSGTYELIRTNGEKREISHHSHAYRLNHPLGELIIEEGKNNHTPIDEVIFNYQLHDAKVTVAEQLQGKSGWLTLNLLTIRSFQTDQYMVFTGITDDNEIIDNESCQKLFNLPGQLNSINHGFISPPNNLQSQSQRQLESTLSQAMEANSKFFQEEREKLEKWADDKILAAEQALQDTKAKIRSIKRDSRQAISIEEQQNAQKELRNLEKLQRRQRQQIFDVEDEIIAKRDELIEQLEQRLKQETKIDELFTIRWKVL
ncbi:DEAD/DEAH box helicase [Legionella pneumophila serogroup 1]|uniref:SNF2-related protein n=1 Tax=Legionella pneumophila TaxID=446 RepID=UPI0007707454|nr:SNF2-related protein [Legionella pneumophila]HAT8944657.1 DEAD/DEAH box helicase [Legionella pneumophila subsp. pneumophila]MCH9059816.1 DEAD/DEAH box helicase [Legionella pneumophila serogroup 1]MCH9062490.1 DEAD/DEAH box helicase [Legionella pneumophila serogroup 1]MCH9065398.1 DEAD/DEAH box helicase [Legionella pneumophila serogroup 1]MCH9068563.1 DEAD/DEAH box helicase [Legionella pneumophila serogroup 1]